MRNAIDFRPVLRLVIELYEDSENYEDMARLTEEEWRAGKMADPPSEADIERGHGRLCEIARLFWRDLSVLYGSVDPAPLYILGEDDLELFKPMLLDVRVERMKAWTEGESYPEPEEVYVEG